MRFALAAVLVVAAASGCAGDDEAATTVATTTVAATTVATTTVAATTVATTTETTTVVVSPTPTETAAAEDEASSPGPRPRNAIRFRGNGDRRLPPLRVRRGGTILRWTNIGEVFSLFTQEGTLVDSVASRGETFLPKGVHRIDVVASGTWVIDIPRARRLR